MMVGQLSFKKDVAEPHIDILKRALETRSLNETVSPSFFVPRELLEVNRSNMPELSDKLEVLIAVDFGKRNICVKSTRPANITRHYFFWSLLGS